MEYFSKGLIEAEKFNLIIYALPSHTSHMIQPLDQDFNAQLKSFFYSRERSFKKRKTKWSFIPIFQEAWQQTTIKSIIQSSFANAGIFPPSIKPLEKYFTDTSLSNLLDEYKKTHSFDIRNDQITSKDTSQTSPINLNIYYSSSNLLPLPTTTQPPRIETISPSSSTYESIEETDSPILLESISPPTKEKLSPSLNQTISPLNQPSLVKSIISPSSRNGDLAKRIVSTVFHSISDEQTSSKKKGNIHARGHLINQELSE